ncbi:MAG TPA: sulfate/thiosulfate ABC transporter permease CysW, partial [Marinobacter sp.]|nr:sulfate/thiosulfate ABC transporter permease CysW [Marinobacter sp.]
MSPEQHRVGDQPWVRRSLIGLAVSLTVILLVIPVVVIFTEALSAGWSTFSDNILDEYSLHA